MVWGCWALGAGPVSSLSSHFKLLGPHMLEQEQNCLSQLSVPAGDTCRAICKIRANKGEFASELSG